MIPPRGLLLQILKSSSEIKGTTPSTKLSAFQQGTTLAQAIANHRSLLVSCHEGTENRALRFDRLTRLHTKESH
jgi:hypothetical protein